MKHSNIIKKKSYLLSNTLFFIFFNLFNVIIHLFVPTKCMLVLKNLTGIKILIKILKKIWEGRGYKMGRGGSEVLPLRKGAGGRKCFSHAEEWGWDTKGFGVVLVQELKVLSTLKGDAKSF